MKTHFDIFTYEFDHSDFQCKKIELFFKEAKKYGYLNNTDWKRLNIERLTPPSGNLWISFYDDQIVSMNGVQQIKYHDYNCWRLLSRGCSLPIVNKILSKNCLSKNFISRSFSLLHIVSKQLDWLDYINQEGYLPVITANAPKNNDDAGKSFKMYNKIMPLLEKQDICKRIDKDILLYGCKQDIYKINIHNYRKARSDEIAKQAQ